jgi:hypothetical protein
MSILEDLFGVPPCRTEQRPEVERLVDELIRIGRTDDFLSESRGGSFNKDYRHIRARQIGTRLDEIGGFELMEFVSRRIKKKLGKNLGSHLDYAWTEIGRWMP